MNKKNTLSCIFCYWYTLDGFAQSNDVSSDITETNNTEDGAEQTNISKTSEQELASWGRYNIVDSLNFKL